MQIGEEKLGHMIIKEEMNINNYFLIDKNMMCISKKRNSTV